MALTEQQRKDRIGKLTASRVWVLATGDETDIYNLWREMVGDPSYDAVAEAERKSLDEKWEIRRGNALEGPVLDWYTFEDNLIVSKRGHMIVHPSHTWIACTLDGWVDDMACPIEVKVNYSGKKFLEVASYYYPQQHWSMFTTGTKKCVFGASLYGHKPNFMVTEFDEDYWGQLWARAQAFWHCVENMIPPVNLPEVLPVVLPENFRTVSMDGNNAWASAAAEWLETKDASKRFDKSKESIKELVEYDVGHAYGYGINAKKAKNGAITIRDGDGFK